MVEVAPSSERLKIPVWKYLLFFFICMLILLAVLWYTLSSNFGAHNSFFEGIRRYLSVFATYHPKLKPEDDFSNALRIHGCEKNQPNKFYLFVSATDKNGSPAKALNSGNATLVVKDTSGNDIRASIDRIRPLHMFSEWTDPISFATVMDYSGSMFAEDLKAIEQNFSELVNQISLPFSAAVVKFNSRVHLIQDLTTNNNDILDAIRKRVNLENTALFDGLDKGLSVIQARPHLRFVVLTTDGNDNASLNSMDDIIRKCSQHGISVFIFGFGWLEVKNLKHMSNSTDGYYSYVPDSSNLSDWFKKLGQIINNVQVIEFSTASDMNMPGSVELSIEHEGDKLNRIRTWQ